MGKLFPLRSIDRVNFFNASQAQIAYAESYQALKYFRASYGKSSFVILLDQLKDGVALDVAMYNAIGADFDTFESEYIKYIGQHYGWLMIFTDMTFIWIGLALLIVVGYLLKKKRGQDTIKRWEEEEKYESTDFDYEEGDPWD
jgi:LPXTG-motif cell wall-anchored protein